jgi:hypothetical protein
MLRLMMRGWQRLRHDGVRTTLFYTVGCRVPLLLGVPVLRLGRVTESLFIGAQHSRLGLRWLARQKIHHVVSLREEYDDAAHGLAPAGYCHLAVTDGTAPTLEQLRQGVAFIRMAITAGGRVYIHCKAGVGRAPTLAIAYLLAEGLSLSEAMERVRTARPFICPEPGQLARLEEFAASITSGA